MSQLDRASTLVSYLLYSFIGKVLRHQSSFPQNWPRGVFCTNLDLVWGNKAQLTIDCSSQNATSVHRELSVKLIE